jgi:hypothetical protein
MLRVQKPYTYCELLRHKARGMPSKGCCSQPQSDQCNLFIECFMKSLRLNAHFFTLGYICDLHIGITLFRRLNS